ncbi:hypothetical protein [Microcoleus sp. FACHB-68]|uniref:hypothetical protein n=1 Tax=Microcoleus sp. FACHB-68 TaxID=2692826 RepID=UPI001689B985|nr:hypothetical protein [Microcoleus sp. FACHB-68]MBD1938456.1 hypothetical protein [Microcoleus sp. FACHB-68]
MTNSTNADVCRFLEQFFDTGNQFERGKLNALKPVSPKFVLDAEITLILQKV